jgi:hypothetical protein
MTEVFLVPVACVVAGALLKYCFDRLNSKQSKPRKELSCVSTYCDELFVPAASVMGPGLEIVYGGSPLRAPAVVNHRIFCCGTAEVSTIDIHISVCEPNHILQATYAGSSPLVAQRVTQMDRKGSLYQLRCGFLNPGEWLDVTLLLSPCHDACNCNVDIAAAGTSVRCHGISPDCSLRNKLR